MRSLRSTAAAMAFAPQSRSPDLESIVLASENAPEAGRPKPYRDRRLLRLPRHAKSPGFTAAPKWRGQEVITSMICWWPSKIANGFEEFFEPPGACRHRVANVSLRPLTGVEIA